jgi:nanoRNase/pAp phosphatase (c-di-AMP/oligoRNAs hydrolase)
VAARSAGGECLGSSENPKGAACPRVRGATEALKVARRRDEEAGMPTPELSLNRTYRLVTRSDFDGLVCAALLKELGLLHDILFVHPKDVQDGKVELTADDITTNLPYRPEVALSFDHHSSEERRVAGGRDNRVMTADADSAARVVYDYFGGAARFPRVSDEMMEAVDRADAAQLSIDDVLEPQGWILLSFLMDPRTGLGRFRDFRISNYQLMMQLIDSCLNMSIEEILDSPDVAERVALYREHADAAAEQILRCSTVYDRVVVLDLRDEEVIHPTNRFLIYALRPECTVSIHVLWGLRQQNTVFAVGRSILDRSSQVDIGTLMLSHGGGGHQAAGTCQIDNARAEVVLDELVQAIIEGERERELVAG